MAQLALTKHQAQTRPYCFHPLGEHSHLTLTDPLLTQNLQGYWCWLQLSLIANRFCSHKGLNSCHVLCMILADTKSCRDASSLLKTHLLLLVYVIFLGSRRMFELKFAAEVSDLTGTWAVGVLVCLHVAGRVRLVVSTVKLFLVFPVAAIACFNFWLSFCRSHGRHVTKTWAMIHRLPHECTFHLNTIFVFLETY